MNPASPIRKLIKAASCGDLKGVNAAIDEGADPYSLNGKAAIEAAISKGYLDILERLFDSRKDVWINQAAIWMAAAHRQAEIVAFLINQGVDVNANNGKALQNAAFHGDIKVVDMLLAAGAKAKNKALQWAAMENHAEAVDRLLQAGADLHVEDDFCLWMAASTGDIPMMEVILRHGADPETPCIKGAIEKYAHLRAWMDRRKIEAFCEEQEAGVGRKAVIARARV